jgi:hypothetical protein
MHCSDIQLNERYNTAMHPDRQLRENFPRFQETISGQPAGLKRTVSRSPYAVIRICETTKGMDFCA